MTASSQTVRELFVAEPPAQYLARPPAVVDCSVLAAFVFAETARDRASSELRGRSLKAPWLLQVEIASVAHKKHGQGAIDAASAGLAQFEALDIEMFSVDPSAVMALALHYRLSVYDASYLWLAAEIKAPLLSFDEKLAKAAAKHLGSLP